MNELDLPRCRTASRVAPWPQQVRLRTAPATLEHLARRGQRAPGAACIAAPAAGFARLHFQRNAARVGATQRKRIFYEVTLYRCNNSSRASSKGTKLISPFLAPFGTGERGRCDECFATRNDDGVTSSACEK